ncbi:hypothetical protein ACJX0J_022298, partial [Zea mays]
RSGGHPISPGKKMQVCLIFANRKQFSRRSSRMRLGRPQVLHHQHLPWLPCRLGRPQDIHAEAVKKRRCPTKKPYSRSINRAEKPDVCGAVREAAL